MSNQEPQEKPRYTLNNFWLLIFAGFILGSWFAHVYLI